MLGTDSPETWHNRHCFDPPEAPAGRFPLVGKVLPDDPGESDPRARLAGLRLEGGAVRQHGEFSADHGLTWQTTFDFTYRPQGSAKK